MSLKTAQNSKTMVFFSVFWCGVVLSIIIAANTGNLGWAYRLAELIPLFDKLGHAFLFGGMSFVTGLALPSSKTCSTITFMPVRYIPVGSWLVLLFSVLEEFSQLFLSHRNFDLMDLLVNVLAICLGGLMAHCTVCQRRRC